MVEVARESQEDDVVNQVTFNAGRHKDVDMHVLAVPLADAEARKVFGDELDVVVGTGKKSAFVAL